MPKVRKLDNFPKRKVTVDDILQVDDVNDVIDDIASNKYDIDEVVVIYTLKGENNFHWHTNGMYNSRLVYMFESIKSDVLRGDDA